MTKLNNHLIIWNSKKYLNYYKSFIQLLMDNYVRFKIYD